MKSKPLSEKRKELFEIMIKKYPLGAGRFYRIIRQQDAEAVKELKEEVKGLSHKYYEGIEMVSVKELFKLIDDKIFGEFDNRPKCQEKDWKCLTCGEEVNNGEKCKCMRDSVPQKSVQNDVCVNCGHEEKHHRNGKCYELDCDCSCEKFKQKTEVVE